MNAALRMALLCGVLATGSVCIRAGPEARETADIELVRRPVIDAAKLGDMRGGLILGGLDYSVGAVMRTLVDGSVVLESAIDLGSLTDTDVVNNFALQDAKGFTEITHDLSSNRVVATVVNQANQREIRVELDINVTLQNYQSLQGVSVRNRILNSLNGSARP